jgi:riboflavin kinase/FMN adenylyltransferase
VLFPDDNDLRLLNTLAEKIELLSKTGIEHLIVHPFTAAFSRTTVHDYLNEILISKLDVQTLVIGYDHHFGRNREGNLSNLKSLGPQYGFEVEEISAQVIDQVNISSTKIRNALLSGNVDKATEWLGYEYGVSGKVVKGNALGRSLGYPTANIEVEDALKLIPGNGVYAVKVHFGDQVYHGMANIGIRPTVSTELRKPSLEVNLFGFNGDIYGKELHVTFASRLRDEIKFNNLELLKAQLDRDTKDARSFFTSHPGKHTMGGY